MSRNQQWLDSERERLRQKTRGWLIAWLSWADPNGAYLDESYEVPLSQSELVDAVMDHVADTLETPEEMRALAEVGRRYR